MSFMAVLLLWTPSQSYAIDSKETIEKWLKTLKVIAGNNDSW